MKGLGFACLANTRRASHTTPSRSSSHIPQFENMPSVNVTYSARIARKKRLEMYSESHRLEPACQFQRSRVSNDADEYDPDGTGTWVHAV